MAVAAAAVVQNRPGAAPLAQAADQLARPAAPFGRPLGGRPAAVWPTDRGALRSANWWTVDREGGGGLCIILTDFYNRLDITRRNWIRDAP